MNSGMHGPIFFTKGVFFPFEFKGSSKELIWDRQKLVWILYKAVYETFLTLPNQYTQNGKSVHFLDHLVYQPKGLIQS